MNSKSILLENLDRQTKAMVLAIKYLQRLDFEPSQILDRRLLYDNYQVFCSLNDCSITIKNNIFTMVSNVYFINSGYLPVSFSNTTKRNNANFTLIKIEPFSLTEEQVKERKDDIIKLN
jgi:hypothetical protein